MEIRQLKEITKEIALAFGKLIPQISANSKVPSNKELEEIVNSKNSFLFVVEEKGEIVGTLTLVTYRIPTGQKAWIEDVVVDKSMRGKGMGQFLTQYAIDFAIKKGINTIDLTSSPFRVAANKLYQKIGFEKRDTNVYRLTMK